MAFYTGFYILVSGSNIVFAVDAFAGLIPLLCVTFGGMKQDLHRKYG